MEKEISIDIAELRRDLRNISAEMVCVNKRPPKVIQCDADGDSIFELEYLSDSLHKKKQEAVLSNI